jgi:acylglycerol lipase
MHCREIHAEPSQRTFRAPDGLTLRGGVWTPEGPARAVVVFVHGIFEHHARYVALAEALRQRGYVFYGWDLRGHGRSDGDRAWVETFGQFTADLNVVVAEARRECPGLPVFLLGNSMGGAIAATYLLEAPRDVAGVIFSAPAFQVGGHVFPLLRRFAGLLSRLWPRLRLFRVRAGRMSRDPAVVADFQSDPLVFHGRFPVRIGAEVLKAARRISEARRRLRAAMLLLHGTSDGITDAEGSARIHADALAADKTLNLYEGLYHDLFHEPERERVAADVLAWLDARTTEIPAGLAPRRAAGE